MQKKRIAILGSTGSIGTQSLDVIRQHSDKFEVMVLTAGNNAELLIKQAREFEPDAVVIGNETLYNSVKNGLSDLPIKVYAGETAIAQVAAHENVDVVLTAMVGYSGLKPTIEAIKMGRRIALANKETLVVAGDLITSLVAKHKAEVVPVDSEHSALFQCLVGEGANRVEKLILTASGGPFRNRSLEFLQQATCHQALKHPNWDMGAKITIDSATLINKGFEVIEAKWLFGVRPDQIEVVVHPQSIIHSMVQFVDGSIKAQMGLPDMKLPIQYALSFPDRIDSNFPRLSFMAYPELSFEQPDVDKFRNLELAYYAMYKGGNMACILNAANEIMVDAFLHEKVGFLQMSDIIEKTMGKATFIEAPSYDDYVASNFEARQIATNLL